MTAQILQVLERFGFRINDDTPRDIVGRHPIHYAALHGHCDFVLALLKQVRICAAPVRLLCARCFGSPGFFAQGVCVELADSSQASPLYYAARCTLS